MDPSLIVIVITVFSSFSLSYGTRVIVEQVRTCNGKQGTVTDISGLEVFRSKTDGWGLKGSILLLKDLPPNATIGATIYKSLFRWIPVVPIPQMKVCDFVEMDNFLWKIIKQHSTLPRECPILVGEYDFKDGLVTEKDLPWFIPRGCFKINMKLQIGSSTVGCYDIIGNVAEGRIPRRKRCI